MTSTSARRPRSLGALAIVPLALAALGGCSDDDLTEQTSQRVKRLSDFDDDGMYVSDDCMRPDGSDGCVIMPGPTECTYLQVTTTTTVLVDSAGNVVREETSECVSCLAADLTLISETCSGTTSPVVCVPALATTGETMGPDTGECWICTYPDGTTSYECIDPTTYCTSDTDCPAGSHCEFYPPPPTCDPAAGYPCDTPAGAAETDAPIAPGGQCVPDAPLACASDADCPAGYYCELYAYPTDPGTSGGGDDGSSGGVPAPDLWAGGQCLPLPPPPPACASDADCGPGGVCIITCTDPAPPDGTGCAGYCQYEPPPPCGCSAYADQMSCEADPRCDWFSEFVPCDPSGTCGGYGYCGAAPPSP